ncbi:hypothetical protein [Burkholderia multivorans]|uniref:hypothetical protein n=1 Tax=Burkholderia multivorans TaxID=87883 RepID=UPI0018AF9982|nr:hypothetical protein [Burkholderia multivorans]
MEAVIEQRLIFIGREHGEHAWASSSRSIVAIIGHGNTGTSRCGDTRMGALRSGFAAADMEAAILEIASKAGVEQQSAKARG